MSTRENIRLIARTPLPSHIGRNFIDGLKCVYRMKSTKHEIWPTGYKT